MHCIEHIMKSLSVFPCCVCVGNPEKSSNDVQFIFCSALSFYPIRTTKLSTLVPQGIPDVAVYLVVTSGSLTAHARRLTSVFCEFSLSSTVASSFFLRFSPNLTPRYVTKFLRPSSFVSKIGNNLCACAAIEFPFLTFYAVIGD